MCEHGQTEVLRVNVPASLSYTGEARWTFKHVDQCIAPVVSALNAAGVLTANSCCGHGKVPASIILQDGRDLTALATRVDGRTPTRWAVAGVRV